MPTITTKKRQSKRTPRVSRTIRLARERSEQLDNWASLAFDQFYGASGIVLDRLIAFGAANGFDPKIATQTRKV